MATRRDEPQHRWITSMDAGQVSEQAIEAVERALGKPYVKLAPDIRYFATKAANEVLKPIRNAIEQIPAGLDAVDLYDELLRIYNLTGGHCEECRKE